MKRCKGGGYVAKHSEALQSQFTQLYNDYRQEIYQFCYSRLHGDVQAAEDCMQDAFIVLYKRMKSGEQIQHPRAFLYKTAYNITMKFLQRRQKQLKLEATMNDSSAELPDERFDICEQLDYEQLQDMLTSLLSEQEQQLYKLYFQQELKVKEIAATLHIAPHTCTMRLSRLRSKVKTIILQYRKGGDNDANGE